MIMRCPTRRRAATGLALLSVLLPALLLLGGCVSRTTRSVDARPAVPVTAAPQVVNGTALRIGVAVFDANVPGDYEEMLAEGIIPEVRKAEASYLPYMLKNVLQASGQWAEVRVLPRLSNAIDVTLLSRIESSDGEQMALTVAATDATGRVWFNREYEGATSKYAYDAAVPREIDPFRDLYRKVSDDLAAFFASLSPEQVREIRRVAELRFANEMAPEAFAEYLRILPNGQVEVRRLPADNDPMVERIQRVRNREYAFIDALDEHYANFNRAMRDPYQRYRRASYEQAVERRRLLEEARNRTIGGAAAVLGGIAAATQSEGTYGQAGGLVSVASGAQLLKSGFDRRIDARLHADALVELGTSLDAEVTPHALALDSETLTLSGTVDEQYKDLRTALARAWRRDLGLPESGAEAISTDGGALPLIGGPSIGDSDAAVPVDALPAARLEPSAGSGDERDEPVPSPAPTTLPGALTPDPER